MHPEIQKAERRIIEAFNSKAKNGIQEIKNLCRVHKISPVATQIADFFHKHKNNLDLESVGDYLSGPDEEQILVLQAFTEQIDFSEQTFTDGLRHFLKAFKLPGEAQKIDRLVESFSQAYFKQHHDSGEIANADAAYVLAFQIIMLNTDLHNPNIPEKNKMTFDALKRNLQGANDDGNFSDEFLKRIYDNIKATPFELNFVKTNPGFELSSNELSNDSTFQKLNAMLSSSHPHVEDVFSNIDPNVTVSIDQPKSWLHNLVGYQGTITLSDRSSTPLVTIQVYKPGFFSEWLFGEQPRLIVQPTHQHENPEKAIEMAAKVAASFTAPLKSIKATYDYVKSDLENAYREQKALIPHTQDAHQNTFKSLKEQVQALREEETPQAHLKPPSKS